jgi:hypothetical protein
MKLHKITGFRAEWFSVSSNITSTFRTIGMLKTFVKQNCDSNKTFKNVRDILLYQTSFI